MPSEIVYDIFPLPGVTPNYKAQIDWANKILAANHPEIAVTAKVGQVKPFPKDNEDAKGRDTPAMGASTDKGYRYSEDQKKLLNSKHVQGGVDGGEVVGGAVGGGLVGGAIGGAMGGPVGGAIGAGVGGLLGGLGGALKGLLSGVGSGHVAVIWADSFSTGELGEAVNGNVWDDTYSGKNGIFMSRTSSSDKSCLLHETGHLAGLQHDDSDNTELMHSTAPNLTKITKEHKKAIANASF